VQYVTLPPGHEERDFNLASRIFDELGLQELHVFWTPRQQPLSPSPARRLPGRDPLGLPGIIGLLGLVAAHVGKRLQR
jgi:hypothetical protein